MLLWFSILILGLYGLMMALFRWGIFRLNKRTVTVNNIPLISVVIALKNEEKHIEALVESIKKVDYPKGKFEIILVNDHSTDRTAEMLRKLVSTGINVILNKGNGKKSALITGVEFAKGEWIAVTDGDCIVPRLWLQNMLKVRVVETKMVLGPVFIDSEESDPAILKALQTIEFLGLQGVTAGSSGLGIPISANGANMMFHKESFNEIQPYKDNLQISTGDDQFLMMKMQEEKENSITYCMNQNAIVRTQAMDNWNSYFRQRIRWASKGSSYKNNTIILVGAIVILTSFLMIYTLISGVLKSSYTTLGYVFIFKMLVDALVILPMTKFSKSKFRLLHYLISGMVYPFIVIGTTLLGVFRR